MAAPVKSKTDNKKSLQNAVSGLQRYLSGDRMEKLQEALSYVRKKIGSDDEMTELFRELGGISAVLASVRKLVTKCSGSHEQESCAYHARLAKAVDTRMKGSDCSTSAKSPQKGRSEQLPLAAELVERCEMQRSIMKSLEIAISVLANCCYVDPPSQKKVSSLLGIPLLAITFNSTHEESLLNRIARCLANMCSSPTILEQILDEKFVENLVPQLDRTENEDCQRTYIRTIRLLSASKRGLCEVVQQRGIVAVARKIASSNVEVKKAAVRAILDMAGSRRFDADAYEQIVVSKCLEQIVPWLSSEDSNLRHDAQSIIYKLLVSDQIRADFGNAGGIDYLHEQLKSPETRKSSLLQSLLWCTRESVNRVKIRECGGLDLLIELLSADDFINHRADIIAGFCNFIYDEITMQRLIEKRIVSTLVDLLLKLNDIPRLDLYRLTKKIAESYYEESKRTSAHVTKYSMDSPSYEQTEWEWSGEVGDVLCKTSFTPIGWNSPRSDSTSSGGFSPAPSCSYSLPSPSSERGESPRRSPSPPPSPPSPLLPEVDEEPLSSNEDESTSEPTRPQKASNHILALLLRFTEIDHLALFKEGAMNLTSCLFSYAILVDETSKVVWTLLSRLMNDAELFTEVLDMNWPFLLSIIFVNETPESDQVLRKVLESDCCVEDCDNSDCSISRHLPWTTNVGGFRESKRLMEGFLRLCETYYGKGTLASLISSATKTCMGSVRPSLVANVAALCRAFLQTETAKPLVRSLLTNGGVKYLVESYFVRPDPPAYAAVSLLYLAESLPWQDDDLVKNFEIETDAVVSSAMENCRKRKAQNVDSTAPQVKRLRRTVESHENNENEVTILLDDGIQIVADASSLCEASDVFQAMLRGHFLESSQNTVHLKGVKSSHLKFILNHLQDHSTSDLSNDHALEMLDYLELLRFCDQYLLSDVKKLLLLKICKTASVDNILHVLRCAILLNASNLVDFCSEFVFSSRETSMGRKICHFKRIVDEFSDEIRVDLAESVLRVLTQKIRQIPTSRNKS